MIQWLQKYSGRGINGENLDKVELKNIHREMKHYKKNMKKKTKTLLSFQMKKKKRLKMIKKKLMKLLIKNFKKKG